MAVQITYGSGGYIQLEAAGNWWEIYIPYSLYQQSSTVDVLCNGSAIWSQSISSAGNFHANGSTGAGNIQVRAGNPVNKTSAGIQVDGGGGPGGGGGAGRPPTPTDLTVNDAGDNWVDISVNKQGWGEQTVFALNGDQVNFISFDSGSHSSSGRITSDRFIKDGENRLQGWNVDDNGGNWSDGTNVVHFSLRKPPNKPVINSDPSGNSTNSDTIVYRQSQGANAGIPSAYYWVWYVVRRSDGAILVDANYGSGDTGGGADGLSYVDNGRTDIRINGLKRGHAYTMRYAWWNGVGGDGADGNTWFWADERNFQSTNTVVDKPQAPQVIETRLSSITIREPKPGNSGGGTECTEMNLVLEYTDKESGEVKQIVSANILNDANWKNTGEFVQNGLDPNQHYKIWIRARNSNESGVSWQEGSPDQGWVLSDTQDFDTPAAIRVSTGAGQYQGALPWVYLNGTWNDWRKTKIWVFVGEDGYGDWHETQS